MKLKSLVLAGIMATLTLSVAFAKTYDLTFASATKVGNTQLKAGDYTLKVEGTKATFTNKDDKSITVDIKIQTSDKKFEYTKVEASNEGGTNVVKDIELGGSKTKIDF